MVRHGGAGLHCPPAHEKKCQKDLVIRIERDEDSGAYQVYLKQLVAEKMGPSPKCYD